jgi:nicotinic acid mononucleotide adenylyltransferase
MPSCTRADKAIATSESDRLHMLNVVKATSFSSAARLVVSDLEIRLGPPTQLRRTLAALTHSQPATEFWFAYGGDSYHDMANWEGAGNFMPILRMIVFSEYAVPASDRLLQLHLPDSVWEVSSTQVRAALAQGFDTADWISQPVRQYALEHHLYT